MNTDIYILIYLFGLVLGVWMGWIGATSVKAQYPWLPATLFGIFWFITIPIPISLVVAVRKIREIRGNRK